MQLSLILNKETGEPEREDANKEEGWVDLNNLVQVKEQQVEKEFLGPIKKLKDEIVSRFGLAQIFLIHGIEDEHILDESKLINAYPELGALIGIGRGNPNEKPPYDERLSADPSTISNLIDLLRDKIKAEEALPRHKRRSYAGWDRRNLNQLFTERNNNDPNVQSVQIEIKMTGYRYETQVSYTAGIFAEAFAKMDSFKEMKTLPTAAAEAEPDLDLVDRAYAKLSDIFYSHAGDAAFKVGEFIVREFFNNEIELVKSQSPVKELSLNQLINKIQSSYHKQPSRSWVLQAVKLYVETRELETTVQTYGQLLISHKILLFPIRNRDTKIQLIQETVQNKYTIVDLKNRIAELVTTEKPKLEAPKSLLQVVTNPDLLFSENYALDRDVKSLSELKPAQLEKIHKKANAKLLDIEHDVEEIELKLTTQREYARNYKKLLKSIEHAKINGKESNKKRVKSEFKGSEKAKTITDDGVEKGAVATAKTSERGFDRNRFYLLLSAFQKSIRWCEVNASRYFARELMDMGMPGAVFNRLILIAAEDVGLADPSLVVYEREHSDSFEDLIKQNKMKKRDAVKFPVLCNIVDRAVIAAAIAYKSRLLPQFSFATLFDIYQKEDFSKNLPDYLDRFVEALGMKDEKQALYYAYVAGIFLNSMDKILALIQRQIGLRNGDLNRKWVDEYKRKGELLMLAGSVALLCRDLQYPHGEYNDAVYQHLSSPINEANIPDRAYDMHTSVRERRGRGLEHFFDEAATVKNERFPNNWEQAGRNSYISAEKKGLEKAAKVIEAIKEKHEKYKKS